MDKKFNTDIITPIYYQNKFSTIYCFIFNATDSTTKKEIIVCEHIYPYKKRMYIFDKEIFYTSFQLCTEEFIDNELNKFNHIDRKFNIDTITPIYYKNKYGGIYCFITYANDTITDDEYIVYEHVYPYPKCTYVRPKNEFYVNFKMIDNDELEIQLQRDCQEFQKDILEKKNQKLQLNLI